MDKDEFEKILMIGEVYAKEFNEKYGSLMESIVKGAAEMYEEKDFNNYNVFQEYLKALVRLMDQMKLKPGEDFTKYMPWGEA